MKRLLTATLVAACLVGVTACGSDDKKIESREEHARESVASDEQRRDATQQIANAAR